MRLKKITVEGYRAAAQAKISCEFKSRFSLILGANGSGKTTINEAIALAHPTRFPWMPPIDASVLGNSPRKVTVEYAYEEEESEESVFEKQLKSRQIPAPNWESMLERSMGSVRVRRKTINDVPRDNIRLIHLPAVRNPIDELSRRDAQILLELFRAVERASSGKASLASLKSQAKYLLDAIIKNSAVVSVENKISQNMSRLSSGVSEHHAFVGTQVIDDAYHARVFEMLLALENDRDIAKRLQVSSLGYVNLLHIAVVLAGIPNVKSAPAVQSNAGYTSAHVASLGSKSTPVSSQESLDDADVASGESSATDAGDSEEHSIDEGIEMPSELRKARQRIEEAERVADTEADSFYPDQFHVVVLIEEPEAHLHPQLQYGLIRYLRELATERKDIQVIVTTHSADLAASCEPKDVIIMRKDANGVPAARTLTDVPIRKKELKEYLIGQTKLHLDATRASALFADRLLLVEGVTEAAILRQFGRAWAKGDERKVAQIDALAILPLGRKVGPWPIQLLATPGYELVTRVAALTDTDVKGDKPRSAHRPPEWHEDLNSDVARFFWSHPTLEPSLVSGNEEMVRRSMGFAANTPISPLIVRQYFDKHSGRKGEFAIRFSREIDRQLAKGSSVHIPDEIRKMFDWLFDDCSNSVATSGDVHDYVE